MNSDQSFRLASEAAEREIDTVTSGMSSRLASSNPGRNIFAATKMRARIPAEFGAIRTEPGNLCLRKTAWWGWEDSNF